jgi:Ca-activated chloride channel homolog
MKENSWSWSASLLLVVCSGIALAAQQPSFRADTQLVSIFATVTDRDGRLVPDLSAGDFEVFDEGRRQPLAFFTSEVEPLAAILMLDTSASMTLVLDRLRQAAEQLVIRLLPGDRARICAFNDKIRFSDGFTNDRDSLSRSVRDADFGNGTRLYDALAASLNVLKTSDRRRVIVVFTDGEDTESKTRVRYVVNRARAEDVMIYVIGLEGRHFDGDEFVDSEPDPKLRTLARETGGGYFELERTSGLASTFRRVGEELHSQYVLAFVPTSPDGHVHKLRVRVKNRRLTVRARRSYLAASPQQGHSH